MADPSLCMMAAPLWISAEQIKLPIYIFALSDFTLKIKYWHLDSFSRFFSHASTQKAIVRRLGNIDSHKYRYGKMKINKKFKSVDRLSATTSTILFSSPIRGDNKRKINGTHLRKKKERKKNVGALDTNHRRIR